MAEAIKLSIENISTIANRTGKSKREIEAMFNEAFQQEEVRFIVFDVTVDGFYHKWCSMEENEFFEKFDFIDPTRSNKLCVA